MNLHRRYFIGWLDPLEYANFYSKLDFSALIRPRFNPLNIQGAMYIQAFDMKSKSRLPISPQLSKNDVEEHCLLK